MNKKFIVAPTKDIFHSAKGTTWEKHKYIKMEDGKYYYPDSYAGGRHLPKNGEEDKNEYVESNEPTGWENKLYSDFESGLKGANGKLDPKAVQQMLLFGKDDGGKGYDNFKIALQKAGVDVDKIDEKSLNLMRYKVVEHYKQEFEKEKDNFDEQGNRTKDRTEEQEKKIKESSKKSKKESKKDSEKETEESDNKEEKKTSKSSKKSKSNKKSSNSSSKKSSSKSDKESEINGSTVTKRVAEQRERERKAKKNMENKRKSMNYAKERGLIKHGLIETPKYIIRPTGLHW